MKNDTYLLNTAGLRTLDEALDPEDGRLRVLSAAFWAATRREERALFGVRNGLYSFPTVELVQRLREIIGPRRAIEIGAGHGVLAEALHIPATDSYQQLVPKYLLQYKAMGQGIAPYGRNVEPLDARAAIEKHRPEVVIGCWVTHRYDPRRPLDKGNEVGVDEGWILKRCQTYIHIGHEGVHHRKPIRRLEHYVEYPSWLYSRAMSDGRDYLAIWGKP